MVRDRRGTFLHTVLEVALLLLRSVSRSTRIVHFTGGVSQHAPGQRGSVVPSMQGLDIGGWTVWMRLLMGMHAHTLSHPIGGSKGALPACPPPLTVQTFLNFMPFLGIFEKKLYVGIPSNGWRPFLWKTWIRPCWHRKYASCWNAFLYKLKLTNLFEFLS